MIVQALNILDKEVIDKSDGSKVGHLEDFIVDPREKKVSVIGVATKQGKRYVTVSDLGSMGEDVVMLSSKDRLRQEDQLSEEQKKVIEDQVDTAYISQSRVITESGKELGLIRDFAFDTETGHVEHFIVSKGLKDIVAGRKHISMENVKTIGKDRTIVSDQAAKQSGGSSVSSTYEDVKGKVEEAAQDVKEKASETGKEAEQKVKQGYSDSDVKEVVGKYLIKNIITSSDEIIAKRGDLISNDVINRAKQKDMVGQVVKYSSNNPIREEGNINLK